MKTIKKNCGLIIGHKGPTEDAARNVSDREFHTLIHRIPKKLQRILDIQAGLNIFKYEFLV